MKDDFCPPCGQWQTLHRTKIPKAGSDLMQVFYISTMEAKCKFPLEWFVSNAQILSCRLLCSYKWMGRILSQPQMWLHPVCYSETFFCYLPDLYCQGNKMPNVEKFYLVPAYAFLSCWSCFILRSNKGCDFSYLSVLALQRRLLLILYLLQCSKPIKTKFSDKRVNAHSHGPLWVRLHNILSWEMCASTSSSQLHFKGGEWLWL